MVFSWGSWWWWPPRHEPQRRTVQLQQAVILGPLQRLGRRARHKSFACRDETCLECAFRYTKFGSLRCMAIPRCDATKGLLLSLGQALRRLRDFVKPS